MEQVTLTSKDFKALSSENRIKILKLLQQQNHTLTEISKKLELSSPTAKQHLEVLTQAQLIELNDEGRKWKYYSLTRIGKKILESKEKQTQIFIMLSVAAVAIFATAALLMMQQPVQLSSLNLPPTITGNEESALPFNEKGQSPPKTPATDQEISRADMQAPLALYAQSTAIDCGKITAMQEEIEKIRNCLNAAFTECRKSKAISELSTIEGDKIVTFIEIQGKENNNCKVFVHKASNDIFGQTGNFEEKCFELNSQHPFESCQN